MSGMTPSTTSTEGAQLRVHCANCGRDKNHIVIKAVDLSGHDTEHGVDFEASYQILKCLGCDAHSFRKTSSVSNDFDPEDGEPIVREEQYPSPELGRLAK